MVVKSSVDVAACWIHAGKLVRHNSALWTVPYGRSNGELIRTPAAVTHHVTDRTKHFSQLPQAHGRIVSKRRHLNNSPQREHVQRTVLACGHSTTPHA